MEPAPSQYCKPPGPFDHQGAPLFRQQRTVKNDTPAANTHNELVALDLLRATCCGGN